MMLCLWLARLKVVMITGMTLGGWVLLTARIILL